MRQKGKIGMPDDGGESVNAMEDGEKKYVSLVNRVGIIPCYTMMVTMVGGVIMAGKGVIDRDGENLVIGTGVMGVGYVIYRALDYFTKDKRYQ